MKLALRARSVYKKVTLVTTAFVLAVSSLTASVPFILSQSAHALSEVHTTDMSTWDLSDTRTTGHYQLVSNGLHVWTEGTTSTDKSAGYYPAQPGLKLSDVNSTAINFASFSGGRPSVQLGVDRDGNGTWDGYLVYEPWAYGNGQYWTNKTGFGVPAGGGYPSMGTLAEYQAANPNAKVLSIGYSLGSGVLGDAVISSIVVGDTNYTFGLPPVTLTAPTNLVLKDGAQGYTTIPTGVVSNTHNPVNAQLSWDPVANATGYSIEVYKDGQLVGGSSFGWNGSWVGFDGNNFGKAGDGSYTFIACATNPAAVVTKVCSTPTAAYIYDTTAPTVTGIDQVFEDHNGPRVNVTLTFSEPIDPTSLPQGWYPVSGTGNTKFVKAYYSTKNYTITFKDLAGNVGSYNFTVDMTAPSGTLSYSPSTLTNGGVTVTLTTSEPIKQSSLPGTWLKKSDTKYQKVYFANTSQVVTLEDLTGNKSYVTVSINWIDTTAPSVTLKTSPDTIGSGPYQKVSYKLFDANKVDKAEINGHLIDLSNNEWSDLNNIAVGSMFGVLGTNTLKVWDVAGNVTTQTFVLDNVAPTATFAYSNNNGAAVTNQDVTVTMTTSEPIQTPSGWTPVDATHFTKVYSNNAKDSVTISDFATNTSVQNYEVKRIDKVAPVITGVTNGQTTRGTVTFNVNDQNFNKLYINGTQVATNHPGGWDYTPVNALSGDGTYIISATDKGGNETDVTVTIDNTLTATFDPIDEDTLTPALTGAVAYTADGTPLANSDVVVNVDGTDYPTATDADGKWVAGVAVANGPHTVTLSRVNSDASQTPANGTASFTTAVTPTDTQTGTDGGTPTGDGSTQQNTPNTNTPTPVAFPAAVNPGTFAQVLGDSTTNTNNGNTPNGSSDVKGTSTDNNKNLASAIGTTSDGTVFGMAWYWWLLILAAIATIIWWIIAAIRNRAAANS